MPKNKIQTIQPAQELKRKIRFSFEYYDLSGKYCIRGWDKEDIGMTLNRLREVNSRTHFDMVRDARGFHFHEVYWEKTIEKQGFPNIEVNRLPPFQFGLIGVNNKKARVYGAYADYTFYIVWFDFDHKIWPTFLRNS